MHTIRILGLHYQLRQYNIGSFHRKYHNKAACIAYRLICKRKKIKYRKKQEMLVADLPLLIILGYFKFYV